MPPLDNWPMLLKAGLASLVLLVVSRLLGLLRESAQAAAFGASAVADVVVLMLTLPDWLTGLVASGALAYALLPRWARQDAAARAVEQRHVARRLLAGGLVLSLLLWTFAEPVAAALLPGVPIAQNFSPLQGVRWSAVALPAALLAALWVTRLQHERDFVGMYAANLVINGVLVSALLAIAYWSKGSDAVASVGAALILAVSLRLVWLRWRLRAVASCPATEGTLAPEPALPASVWVWAALSAGLPLALPFVARSLASQSGEGVLSLFNYAWKLVELPLVLAVQLVASLAFPSITRAFAGEGDPAVSVRRAFALAWTLACAAVAGLLIGAPAVSGLLFGWGRMGPEDLARIAAWGAVGSWSLLPQALVAVALTVLATQGRMRAVAWAYAAALVVLIAASPWAAGDGERLMWLLNALNTAVAVVLVAVAGRELRTWIPWRPMAATAAVLWSVGLLASVSTNWLATVPMAIAIALAAFFAALLIAIGCVADPGLRASLRR